MGKQKSRKGRQQRWSRVDRPMVTETHRRLALELRAAAETLIGAPSVETFNQLSKMLAALSTAGMFGQAMDLATGAMGEICDRYERVGKVGVKQEEAEQLRLALAAIDGKLPSITLNKFEESVAEVEVFCASVGA